MKPRRKKPRGCRLRPSPSDLSGETICPEGVAFGLVLREERVRQRLSQDDLAALSGVGRVSIGDLEAGKGCGPSYYVGTKLARALGLYFDVLVKRARVMVEA